MERDVRNHSRGAEAVFERMDKNVTGLEEQIDWRKAESKVTLGARGPGTSDHMLRTLRSLVKFTWLLISNNISGTFQM